MHTSKSHKEHKHHKHHKSNSKSLGGGITENLLQLFDMTAQQETKPDIAELDTTTTKRKKKIDIDMTFNWKILRNNNT